MFYGFPQLTDEILSKTNQRQTVPIANRFTRTELRLLGRNKIRHAPLSE
jgi:hypothetical protein